jgi:hypothetical protein
MADRAVRIYPDEQGIVITIFQYFHHIHEIPALLPFGPQTFFAPGIKCDPSLFQSLPMGFFVHKSQHQYLVRFCILDNGGKNASQFLKIQ